MKTTSLFEGSRVWRTLLAVAVFALLLLPASAQVNTADILGTVTDASGAVLPGAKITVENLDTNLTRSTTSDSSGSFLVTLLPVGRYRVRAELAGFRTFNVPEVSLALGDRLRLDAHMEVGQIEQSVEVTAQTTALQSDSSTVGTLINDRTVEDAPLNGRNFVRLAQLAAGANESVPNAMNSGNRPDDRRRSSSISVNGMRDYSNSFMIDGVDDNERYIGTSMVKPSMDALEEFRVQTNLYSAEVGRTAGGVINLITKSGTNALHGSVFEFFRSEHLDARNFFAAPPPAAKPVYKQNQYGGALGGPIKKNKTFFFADYEGLRLRQGQTFASTVPTVAMRSGNFAGLNPVFDPLSTVTNAGVSTRSRFTNDQIPASATDIVGQKLINFYPVPTTSGLVNNFVLSPNKTQRDDEFDARIDHRLSDRDSLFGRYSFNDTNTLTPGQLGIVNGIQAGGDTGAFAGPALQRAQGALLNYVHTFKPTLLMELKGSYTRYVVHSLPLNYGNNIDQQIGIPGANADLQSSGLSSVVASGFRGLGDATSLPLLTINNVFQYQGAVTYIRGSHNIKIGGDVRRRQLTPEQSTSPKGQFTFDPNFTNDPSGATSGSGNAAASLLLGYPAITTRQLYLVFPGFRSTEFAGFVQDDWRATRWLTLNLGVRYEVFTPLTEVANRASNVDISTGKVIIAGQNGVGSTVGIGTDWNSFAPRFGFAATINPKTVVRGGFGISFYPGNTGTASNSVFRNPPFVSVLSINPTPLNPVNRISAGLPPPTATDPVNPSGSLLGVDTNLRNSYVEQFNLTVQRELGSGFVWNVGYVGNLVRKQGFGYNINLALPGPGTINPRRPYFAIFPNVATLNYVCSCGVGDYHALQTSLEHRFSKGITLQTNYTYSHMIDDNPGSGGGKPGTGPPYPQLVNNRAIERGNSDLDLRQRWTLVAAYEIPFGKSLTGVAGVLGKGWQVNGVATVQTGLTFTAITASNRSNTGNPIDRANVVGDPTSGATIRTPNQWFNTSAFAINPLYTIGTVGRNTLYGPPLKNLDFSVFKEFKPMERTTLQFRAEMFNILNHPNFGIPGNQVGTAAFGIISDTSNNLSRNVQLALKLLF